MFLIETSLRWLAVFKLWCVRALVIIPCYTRKASRVGPVLHLQPVALQYLLRSRVLISHSAASTPTVSASYRGQSWAKTPPVPGSTGANRCEKEVLSHTPPPPAIWLTRICRASLTRIMTTGVDSDKSGQITADFLLHPIPRLNRLDSLGPLKYCVLYRMFHGECSGNY